jgi:hypothetical protein
MTDNQTSGGLTRNLRIRDASDIPVAYPRIQFQTRELLEVEYLYSDDPDDGDALEAFVYQEHNGIKMWHVGGRCTANYISITDEPAELDAWITMLTEMKRRSKGE